MAQAASKSAKIISIEKDLKWVAVAKRCFVERPSIYLFPVGAAQPSFQPPAWGIACSQAGITSELTYLDLFMRRFISQAKMSKQVDVRWGEAVQELQKLDDKIDFLFLDAVPSEYLAYLKAAEPRFSDGAVIVADNAGA